MAWVGGAVRKEERKKEKYVVFYLGIKLTKT